MNQLDLTDFRQAWKEQWADQADSLSVKQIDAVMRRESNNMARQFHVALLVDMLLKEACAVALLGLLWLYSQSGTISLLNTSLLALTLFLTFLQWKTRQSIPPAELAGTSIRQCLQGFVQFYRQHFIRSLYIAAVSGALIFYTGVLYYSWFKYGGLRALDLTDAAVFSVGLLLAFGINAAAQRWQAAFHMRELEACLREIDAEALSLARVRQRHFRHFRLRLTWLIWLVLGVLVLVWLIWGRILHV